MPAVAVHVMVCSASEPPLKAREMAALAVGDLKEGRHAFTLKGEAACLTEAAVTLARYTPRASHQEAVPVKILQASG